jgi:GNAT superfamily N-acetyltransferase
LIATLPPGYPAVWAIDAVLADGGTVHVRPIRPDDAAAHRAFFAKQSPQSVYFRFFGHRTELSDREVIRFTTIDYHERMAFVAFLRDEMIAIGRYDRIAGGEEAEVAFAVADEHQGRGLATLLLEYLATYAAGNGITRFAADTLVDNRSMLNVFQAAELRRERRSIEYGVVHVAFDIEPTGDSLRGCERRVADRSQMARAGQDR